VGAVDGGTATGFASPSPVAVAAPVELAGTFDLTTQTATIFVNGAAQAQLMLAMPSTMPATASPRCTIGYDTDLATDVWFGAIDEVRFAARAPSAAEVQIDTLSRRDLLFPAPVFVPTGGP
jgi:hypothetical protein